MRSRKLGKLIVKTAICTLAVLIGLALILFGAVSLAAPAAMLSVADDLGMEKLAASYSVAVYEKTSGVDDLAEAVERNYAAGEYSVCAEYGSLFLKDPGFSDYCAARDRAAGSAEGITGSYSQYASGIVASAQYWTGKKELSLSTAFGAIGETFPQNNAVISLAAAARSGNDKAFCTVLLSELKKLTIEDSSEAASLAEFAAVLSEYCGA